jgi:hypothetical protein
VYDNRNPKLSDFWVAGKGKNFLSKGEFRTEDPKYEENYGRNIQSI